jgi:methanol dehydrogenase (cytochrome c) subunit 2
MKTRTVSLLAACAALTWMSAAHAYDGTKCKAAGDCWEAKPGYPAKIAGSKYDPKHDPVEIAKNEQAVAAMEARNAKRLENAQKTGSFKFDVN